ncbi:MAG: hypothetical protein M3004_08540 [Bacteroidota bacterium]|nr:hypothetical protein [Bacteroidota bacterium]
MKIFYLILIYILIFNTVFAQAVRRPIAAGYVGLGAYSKNHVDAFSVTSNQAALAQIKNSAAGVYGERRFLLSATNMYTAIFVLPTAQGNFGVQADYFGFKNYNESQIGLAYAKSLGSKLDVGIKFNYYGFRIPAYGNSSAVDFEIGAIAHLSEKLNVGIHAYNPVGGKLSKTNNEKLSSIYKFGIGYEASENFFVSTEIIKEEGEPINVEAGFQYNFKKQFFVRAGTSTETTNSYVGAGIAWKNFRLDINGSYHPQLGITPGLLLIINFNKKEN